MAASALIGDDRIGPVAECPRRGGASLFILVQVQAGPPAFAAPLLRLASQSLAKAAPPQLSERRRSHPVAVVPKSPKHPLMAPLKPFPNLRNLV
jgi:hypothetical protein